MVSLPRVSAALFLVAALCVGLVSAVFSQSQGSVIGPSGRPAAAAAAIAADACLWEAYDEAQEGPVPYWRDLESTPPFAIRTNGDFHVAHPSAAGSGTLDFNGDTFTEAFRQYRRSDGFYQWQRVLPPGVFWENMAYAAQPLDALMFGDFNDDSQTDIFSVIYQGSVDREWVYSPGGIGNYTHLNYSSVADSSLALGQFDAQPVDKKTDVFGALASGAKYDYLYSAGGTGTFVQLSQGTYPRPALRFGDFDGNKVSDIFVADAQPDGTYQWRYAPNSASGFVDLARAPYGLNEIQFGDFNLDGTTDVFAMRELADGRLEWLVWYGGRGAPASLNIVDGPPPLLGNFVGGTETDALIFRCGTEAILKARPSQAVPHIKDTLFRYYAGDFDGDGLADLVRVSNCQQYDGFACPETKLLAGLLLSDGSGRFNAGPVQTLLPDAGDLETYVGDVTGDGRTDLVFILVSGTDMLVRVGRAQPGGMFIMNDLQSFVVPKDLNPYLADVDGNGRLDLIGTTTCLIGNGHDAGFCHRSAANTVVTAIADANGMFTLKPVQQFSPDKWHDYNTLLGDVNGDGNIDLVFNSLCQRIKPSDAGCTSGTYNIIYTALGLGTGEFLLDVGNNFGTDSGGKAFRPLIADVTKDGSDDLIWLGRCPAEPIGCNGGDSLLVHVAVAAGLSSFQLRPLQNLGWGHWTAFRMRLGDGDGDGAMDVLLYNPGSPTLPALGYWLFADGSGLFSRSAMQVLNGRAAFDGNGLVGDVNGDGRAELVAYESMPNRESDRVVVAGNFSTRMFFLPMVRR